MSQEMFSIITDKNGNPISKQELEKMDREFWILILQKYIKKMTYLHEDDKSALRHIAYSLFHSFKESN